MSEAEKYEYLSCFYDTQEMRQTFPDSYPDPLWRSVKLVPGRIICSPNLGAFGATVVAVLKDQSYRDRNEEIRREMEINNVVVVKPS
jgi:hypothetical protein